MKLTQKPTTPEQKARLFADGVFELTFTLELTAAEAADLLGVQVVATTASVLPERFDLDLGYSEGKETEG